MVVDPRVDAQVIEPRHTIVDVVPFVGWVKEYVGKYDPALMPEIAKQWKILQSRLVPCDTELEDFIPTQAFVN
jgi:hypothetical protein